jgi:hypothetical protein
MSTARSSHFSWGRSAIAETVDLHAKLIGSFQPAAERKTRLLTHRRARDGIEDHGPVHGLRVALEVVEVHREHAATAAASGNAGEPPATFDGCIVVFKDVDAIGHGAAVDRFGSIGQLARERRLALRQLFLHPLQKRLGLERCDDADRRLSFRGRQLAMVVDRRLDRSQSECARQLAIGGGHRGGNGVGVRGLTSVELVERLKLQGQGRASGEDALELLLPPDARSPFPRQQIDPHAAGEDRLGRGNVAGQVLLIHRDDDPLDALHRVGMIGQELGDVRQRTGTNDGLLSLAVGEPLL